MKIRNARWLLRIQLTFDSLRSRGLAVFVPSVFALIIFCIAGAPISARCQGPAAPPATSPTASATDNPQQADSGNDPMVALEGLPVVHISFEGVSADRLAPLPDHLAQAEGAPLTADNVKRSLRELYASGLYDAVEVEGSRQPGGVALIFAGTPRIFIGTVSVDGAVGATMNTQLQRASQLEAGTRLTQAKMLRAVDQMRTTLEENGYYEAAITQTTTPHPDQQLADIAFRVVSGLRARVGKVTVTGDSGMSLETFRRHAHLRVGAHVDHDTVNRALDGVLREFQRQGRLEADVKLESAEYDTATKSVDYRFTANRGPVVKVEVQGASIPADRVKHLVPIFEEGSVDEDLLNEGNRRLRDYYQRLGYFDAKVDHQSQSPNSNRVDDSFQCPAWPAPPRAESLHRRKSLLRCGDADGSDQRSRRRCSRPPWTL